MPAPSRIAIAMGSLSRLLKEEASYRQEVIDLEGHISKMEQDIKAGGADADGNAEFMLKQNKFALSQTKGIFTPLRQRIREAVVELGHQIDTADDKTNSEELKSAKLMYEDATAT